MNAHSSKLGVSNSRNAPQVVAVEPWGNDYTLLPGEELVIVAYGNGAVPWVNVVEWDGATQVYCEETSDFKVLQDGLELECGHNRQPESAPAPRLSGQLPIVGVIGSGTAEHRDRADALGRWLAGQGVHLLTGGGRGVMAAVSRAFAEAPARQGLVLGILPSVSETSPETPKPGYPNPWVEVPIRTHLHLSGLDGEHPRSRNHLIALTANVLVALPGGAGTASEVRLALRYGTPVIAYLKTRDEIPGLPEDVRAEPEFEQVKAFLTRSLAAAATSR
jgi:uncharacterized protein (TIGR00725 family)